MDQPAVETTGRRPKAALAALAAVVVLAACAGENLFTDVFVGGSGEGAVSVDVTAPAANAAVTLGASLAVTASTTAAAGAHTAVVGGHYDGSDTSAYQTQSINLFDAPTADFNATLVPAAGQIAGTAYIVVTVTDAQGAVGSDSVKITIN